jgi:serine/threonine protein kinase
MFRIVEDDSLPIPERLSDLLVAFLKDCFRKVPSQRPSAKELSQYEWLNLNLNKVRESKPINIESPKTRLQETQLRERILCLPTVNDENDPGYHLEANFDLANPESAPRPARMVWWHRIRKVFTHLPSRAHRRSISALPQVDLDVPGIRGRHTFVDVILSKRAFAPHF